MDITINLAREPFVDLQPILKCLRYAIGVLAFVALVLLVLTLVTCRKTDVARSDLRTLEGRRSIVVRERQSYEAMLRDPESKKVFMQTRDLNRIVDAKALSWTLVMQELEGVLPSGVQVSAIEPARAKDGSITLRLRVLGPRDKSIDLVRHLEVSSRFLSPRIVDESAVGNSGPTQTSTPPGASSITEFDLLAGYNAGSSDLISVPPPGNESVDPAPDHAALERHNEVPSETTGKDVGKSKVHQLASVGGGK